MPETQWGDKPIINELDIRIETVMKKALKYFAEHSLMDREDVENIDKISNYAAFEIMLDVRLIIDNSSLTDAQKVQKIREVTMIYFKGNSIYSPYNARFDEKRRKNLPDLLK